jgi:three-Cys-motif partner protein
VPVVNGVGQSEPTVFKHDHLRHWFDLHIRIVQGILARREWTDPRYWYFDLTAGPGRYNGIIGSPLLFEQAARRRGLQECVSVFFEQDRGRAEELRNALGIGVSPACGSLSWSRTVVAGSYQEHLRNYAPPGRRNAYGLAFLDPNGQIDFKGTAELFALDSLYRVDLMINLAANTIKRSRQFGVERLDESIQRLGDAKSCWLIRTPCSAWQWSILLGSNWDGFPDWKKLGFFRLDSEEGQRILADLTYTKAEKQPELF